MTANRFFKASAPGRLDVMGGIADYSGSLVLQMPIPESTTVNLTLRNDFVCTLVSTTESGECFTAKIDYRDLLNNGKVDYALAKIKFKSLSDARWTAYVLGCALVLQKEKEIDFRGGDFVIESNVPLGKGVSSSASLEVASMKALAQAFDISFRRTELPFFAQRVENLIVGAPCGLMDQLCSYFGEPRKLLPILCQPDLVQESISIPADISFIGIDSGIRHSVGDASYVDVRCATFMGYTMLAQAAGASRKDIDNAIEKKDFSALPFQGYLCNISVSEYEARLKKLFPASITGNEFLGLYGNSIDEVTTIDAARSYNVLECTAHPIYENERVHLFKQLLMSMAQANQNVRVDTITKLGQLMYESHKSYSRCGLGSARTDEIVNLAQELGHGIVGAKITGGGSGGTVCILVSGFEGKESVYRLHQSLCAKYKVKLKLFES